MIIDMLRNMGGRTPPFVFKGLLNIWPPYLGSGIHIDTISSDYRYMKVSLKRAFYNTNYVGTQYGGSIYSMTDPFYMFMFMHNLGSDYYVWDRAASIQFLKPGKTRLSVEFRIDGEILDKVRKETENGDKYVFELPARVYSETGELVAEIVKTLYVRKKKDRR